MPNKGNNPKGVGSSIISIVLFLMILFVPFLGVNLTQRIRSGDGKFDFDDELVFDINDESQFDDSYTTAAGTGAFAWQYFDTISAGVGNNHIKMDTVLSIPLNGTVDGYAVTTTTPKAGTTSGFGAAWANQFVFLLNFTKSKILELDITRVDIYIDISGANFNDLLFKITDEADTASVVPSKRASLGNKTSFKITVLDLLTINTFDPNENIKLLFASNLGEFAPDNSFVVLDMQFYSVKEITTPSLTKVAMWISATALFVIFMGFIVSPEINFDGVMKSMGKIMTRGS